MIGIQVYPDSIVLEGAEAVLDRVQSTIAPQALILCLNEVPDPAFFRMPNPHLPGKAGPRPDGSYCFQPDPDKYRLPGLVPPVHRDGYLAGKDVLRLLCDSAASRGIKVYAWIKLLHLSPLVAERRDLAMVDAMGRRLEQWACPSQKVIRDYTLALVDDILSRYPVAGLVLDGLRFPSFYDGPEDFLGCFCDNCRSLSDGLNFSLDEARDELIRMYHDLARYTPGSVPSWAGFLNGTGADGLMFALEHLPLVHWLQFRSFLISSLVREVYTKVMGEFSGREVALDVWPPAFAWLVGQDYGDLSSFCSWLKPVVYSGDGPGGAAGEVMAFIDGLSAINPELRDALKVESIGRFFGFDLTATRSDGEPGDLAFPSSVFRSEFERARLRTGGRCPVMAGCPIFDGTPEEAAGMVRDILSLEPQGLILYAYDLASFQHLEAAGRALAGVGGG